MELNGFWQVFFGGMLGPILLELVKIAGWKNAKKDLGIYREPLYWVSTAALLVLAGIVVALNGVSQVPVVHAIELGIGAPAIIAGYATASTSRQSPGAGFMGGPTAGTPDKKPLPARMRELLAW